MVALAAAALFIAAKLEEDPGPSSEDIISLVSKPDKSRVTYHTLLDLEVAILIALGFELKFAGPLAFLERYLRLLSLDQPGEKPASTQIGTVSRKFCKYMQRHFEFLEYKPAQQAAAALVLAIDISYSSVSKSFGLKRLEG